MEREKDPGKLEELNVRCGDSPTMNQRETLRIRQQEPEWCWNDGIGEPSGSQTWGNQPCLGQFPWAFFMGTCSEEPHGRGVEKPMSQP